MKIHTLWTYSLLGLYTDTRWSKRSSCRQSKVHQLVLLVSAGQKTILCVVGTYRNWNFCYIRVNCAEWEILSRDMLQDKKDGDESQKSNYRTSSKTHQPSKAIEQS